MIAAHPDIPHRVAGFHAHLGAEKALKALLVRRDVPTPRIHDLHGLHRLLHADDQERFDEDDLELLNPWTIEGRYPADVGDLERTELEGVLVAARRVVTTARAERFLGESRTDRKEAGDVLGRPGQRRRRATSRQL